VHGAACLGAEVRDIKPGIASEAGEALAGRVIELMRAAGIPNGLSDLGFSERDVDALAIGAEPQWRVIRNAPTDVTRDDLRSLFRAAMRYW
jgi:alcohol dehydrogenase class IV